MDKLIFLDCLWIQGHKSRLRLGNVKVSGNLKFLEKVRFSRFWMIFRRKLWTQGETKYHNVGKWGGKWILKKVSF